MESRGPSAQSIVDLLTIVGRAPNNGWVDMTLTSWTVRIDGLYTWSCPVYCHHISMASWKSYLIQRLEFNGRNRPLYEAKWNSHAYSKNVSPKRTIGAVIENAGMPSDDVTTVIPVWFLKDWQKHIRNFSIYHPRKAMERALSENTQQVPHSRHLFPKRLLFYFHTFLTAKHCRHDFILHLPGPLSISLD